MSAQPAPATAADEACWVIACGHPRAQHPGCCSCPAFLQRGSSVTQPTENTADLFCTCWPSSDHPCAMHGEIQLNPHHEHGHYYGNDIWDAECCICGDFPCPAVTVEDMRRHRWYDIERERRLAAMPTTDEPPF